MLFFYFSYIFRNILRVFERFINGSYCNRDLSFLFLVLSILKIQNVGISLVQTWFINNREPECLFVGVWSFRFEEIFNGTHSGDLVRDEWFDLGFQVHHLRFVHSDLFEQILDFIIHFKVFIVLGVVLPWDLEIVFILITITVHLLLLTFEGGVFEVRVHVFLADERSSLVPVLFLFIRCN